MVGRKSWGDLFGLEVEVFEVGDNVEFLFVFKKGLKGFWSIVG